MSTGNRVVAYPIACCKYIVVASSNPVTRSTNTLARCWMLWNTTVKRWDLLVIKPKAPPVQSVLCHWDTLRQAPALTIIRYSMYCTAGTECLGLSQVACAIWTLLSIDYYSYVALRVDHVASATSCMRPTVVAGSCYTTIDSTSVHCMPLMLLSSHNHIPSTATCAMAAVEPNIMKTNTNMFVLYGLYTAQLCNTQLQWNPRFRTHCWS